MQGAGQVAGDASLDADEQTCDCLRCRGRGPKARLRALNKGLLSWQCIRRGGGGGQQHVVWQDLWPRRRHTAHGRCCRAPRYYTRVAAQAVVCVDSIQILRYQTSARTLNECQVGVDYIAAGSVSETRHGRGWSHSSIWAVFYRFTPGSCTPFVRNLHETPVKRCGVHRHGAAEQSRAPPCITARS